MQNPSLIFDQLKELGVILGTGLIANNIIKFITDPKNAEKVEQIFTTIKNNAGTILTAGILTGLGLVGGVWDLNFLKFIFYSHSKVFYYWNGYLFLPLMLGGSTKKEIYKKIKFDKSLKISG